MIDPGITMVDVEPDGFAVISRLMSDYFRRPRRELHVLHRNGIVQRAIDTHSGAVAELAGRPLENASTLRGETGADRVVLVDENQLHRLAPVLAQAGSAPTQDEMFVRSRRAFFDAPGVAVDPAPSRGLWELWAGHLRDLGDDYVALAAGFSGDACVFSIVARIRNGLVTHVTSLPGALGSTSAQSLVDASANFGIVRIAVVAGLDVFESALAGRALAPLRAHAMIAFGLPENVP